MISRKNHRLKTWTKAIKYILLSLCVAALSFLGSASFVYADSLPLSLTLNFKNQSNGSLLTSNINIAIDGNTYSPNYNFNLGIIPTTFYIDITGFKDATYNLWLDDFSIRYGFETFGYYLTYNNCYILHSDNTTTNINNSVNVSTNLNSYTNLDYSKCQTSIIPKSYDIEIINQFHTGDLLRIEFAFLWNSSNTVTAYDNFKNMCLVGTIPCLKNGAIVVLGSSNDYSSYGSVDYYVSYPTDDFFYTLLKSDNQTGTYHLLSRGIFSTTRYFQPVSLDNSIYNTYINSNYASGNSYFFNVPFYLFDSYSINNITNYFNSYIDDYKQDYNVYLTWNQMSYGNSIGEGGANGPSGSGSSGGGGNSPSDNLSVQEVIDAIESSDNLNDMKDTIDHIDSDIHTLNTAINQILLNSQNLGQITNILTTVQQNGNILQSILNNVIGINQKVTDIYNFLIGNTGAEQASEAQEALDDAGSAMEEHASEVAITTLAPDDIVDSVDSILDQIDGTAQSNIYAPLFLQNPGNIIVTILIMALTISILSYALYGGQ